MLYCMDNKNFVFVLLERVFVCVVCVFVCLYQIDHMYNRTLIFGTKLWNFISCSISAYFVTQLADVS